MPLVFTVKHLTGSLAGRSQRLALSENQSIRLGRSPDSDVKFSEDLDDNVSGVHAELSTDGGRLYIEDKRSSNGTFVNGAPCPAFEKIAVPDGSRIRLAKNGPEMQVVYETAPQAAAVPPAPEPLESSLPPKAAVGRETLLREIDRAKQEERNVMAGELARAKKSTGVWLGLAGAAFLLLVVVGAGATYWLNSREVENARAEADQKTQAVKDELASTVEERIGENVWADIEKRVSPAVGHVRCRYHLERPHLVTDDNSISVRMDSLEVNGSAILIKPGLLLTAKHVVEPWKYSFDWDQIPDYDNWEEFAEAHRITPVYETLEVQFPGFQAIAASLTASSETSDLALLSIPTINVEPVDVLTSNRLISVTEDVSIIGYPRNLGQLRLITFDYSNSRTAMTELTNMEPTFLKGTVTRPVPETGETSHYFFLDASVEPGNSGGPVVNQKGEVIGIVSQKLVVGEMIEFNGVKYPSFQEIRSSARAVSPGDIASFLRRVGVL